MNKIYDLGWAIRDPLTRWWHRRKGHTQGGGPGWTKCTCGQWWER